MTVINGMITHNFGNTDDYPDGPWKNEPDKIQWIDEATGLDCLIVRGPVGSLCGYVGVPPEHPWHGKQYSECVESCGTSDISRREAWENQKSELLASRDAKSNLLTDDMIASMDRMNANSRGDLPAACYEHSPEIRISVHGGITFAASCQEDRPEGICHVPAPGRPKDVWWFGFDTAHAGDASPYDYKRAQVHGEYRTIEYVQAETADMAAQLAEVSNNSIQEPMTS